MVDANPQGFHPPEAAPGLCYCRATRAISVARCFFLRAALGGKRFNRALMPGSAERGTRSYVTWQPMTPEEAEQVLSSDPPESVREVRRWSDRYAEAWMVRSGAPPEQIKAAIEHLTGHRLD